MEQGMPFQYDQTGPKRLQRLEAALAEQKAFIHRVPDPDTRERAEANLILLVQMRDAITGVS